MFIEEFVQVVPDRNQIKLQLHGIQTSAHYSLIPTVIFEYAEGAFCLDRAVHTEKCPVDALKIIQNFFVNGSKLLV